MVLGNNVLSAVNAFDGYCRSHPVQQGAIINGDGYFVD